MGLVVVRVKVPPLVASNVPVFVVEVPEPPIVRPLVEELALTVPMLSRDTYGYTALAFDPISPDPEIVLWLVRTSWEPPVPIWPVLELVDVITSEPGPDSVVLPVSCNWPPSARVPDVVVPRLSVPTIFVTVPDPAV